MTPILEAIAKNVFNARAMMAWEREVREEMRAEMYWDTGQMCAAALVITARMEAREARMVTR